MSGADYQLAATAPQDKYLCVSNSEGSNGEDSFFTPGWLQYGPWDSAVHEIDFPVGLDFNQSTSVVLPVKGDLLGESYLQVTLPALGLEGCWVDSVGYALLDDVQLLLDASLVHGHSSQARDVLGKLMMPSCKLRAVEEMIGRGAALSTMVEHTLFIPFDWFFTDASRRTECRLPMSVMTGSVLQLRVTTQSLANLVLLTDPTIKQLPPVSLQGPLLLLRYYNITKQEKAALANSTILIRQVQETVATNYTVDGSMDVNIKPLLSIPLPFTRDTAYVAWVAQDETLSNSYTYSNCISNAALYFNTSPRFECRSSQHFSHVQCLDYARSVEVGEPIGFYSFCLDAANAQPSGYVALGALDSAVLKLGFGTPEAVSVRVVAAQYNELVIKNNRGSLTFA